MNTDLFTDKEKEIFDNLKMVLDPEIGISIVDLGLIYDVKLEGTTAFVNMTYTSMACPAGPQMKEEVEYYALRIDGVESVVVQIVWVPKWDPKIMASDEAKDILGIL
jgi:metal-sulfur cluster biosynthetic enzyme